MSDEGSEFEVAIPEVAAAPIETAPAELPSESPIDVELPPGEDAPDDKGARRGCGALMLILVGVVVALTAFLSLGTWAVARTKVPVPPVSGRISTAAITRLEDAGLKPGRMQAFATTVFQPDQVMMQNPGHQATLPPGSPVDLLVAVAPSATVTPDVSLDTTMLAEARLGSALLRPVYYRQLSNTVPFGRVVAQMPRAGAPVMTGQQVALFISAGPGTGGALVPDVIGKPIEQAAKTISDAYLVAVLFDPPPGTQLAGAVTDQVPAPGSRVPIGTAVPVFITGAAK